MQKTEPDGLVRFGVFELDARSGELRSKGSRVKLQDQPLQVLLAVLEKPGQVVTREELRARLWPADTFVDFDHGLNAAVKRLRDALGDTAENPRYIETLPRHGYRFIAAAVPDALPPERSHTSLKQWGWLLGVTAVLLVVGALVAVDGGGVRGRLLSRSAAQPQVRSLAVLPLANLSGDPEQEYFADGMTEQLIGELSQLSGLKVISRTSVMQYKGERKKGLPQIGRELNADAVMEGSVLRSGNRVRVAAHMIYARTDQNLLTETYEQDLGDVLKLQREVAESITEKVRLKLTLEEKARLGEVRQVKSEAFDAYLRAMQFNWLGPQGLKEAQSYFIQAIQKDPGFADAYGALADCYVNRADGRLLSPQDAFPPAKQALRRALELDEKNCSAHLAQVWISWRYDWDWAAADREFKYALQLCPNSEEIHWTHTYYAAWAGHGAEALAELEKTRELDPLMTERRFLHAKGLIYYHLRDYKTMVEVGQKLVAAAGGSWLAHYILGTGYEGSGQTLEAISEYQKSVELSAGNQDPAASLGHAYATTGRRGDAQKILRQWQHQMESTYVSPYMFATVYAGLGEKDKAFEYLEKAYQERSSDLPYFLRADLRIDTLRSDPRFQDLLARMNFPK